ncbi:YcxB family protein [Pseudoramibacter porci]|uniref:YcxB family protein n=1 Tax=Pseudoramibacter porci TaxID=2606631 RepID=A0A7X2NE51_9FIRM|nr:YcxB family protein [Pseudoramibacter porci]MSS18902.1 YcxB family protein [Pseudoramibacter porci]
MKPSLASKANPQSIPIPETIPDVTFQVKMNTTYLFDFFLYHAYSKLSGFLVNLLGLAVAFIGLFQYAYHQISPLACGAYVAAAAVFLGYTPLMLKLRAKKVMQNPDQNETTQVTLSEKYGMIKKQGEKTTQYRWDEMERAVVTPKTVGIYLKNDEAIIVPKPDFGDQFVPAFMMITKQLGLKNVRMR